MGKSIFANIDTYIELYEYVAQQPRTRNETEKYLIVQKQKNENTAKVHVRNAVSGDLECIEFKDEKLCFDSDVFKKKISPGDTLAIYCELREIKALLGQRIVIGPVDQKTGGK